MRSPVRRTGVRDPDSTVITGCPNITCSPLGDSRVATAMTIASAATIEITTIAMVDSDRRYQRQAPCAGTDAAVARFISSAPGEGAGCRAGAADRGGSAARGQRGARCLDRLDGEGQRGRAALIGGSCRLRETRRDGERHGAAIREGEVWGGVAVPASQVVRRHPATEAGRTCPPGASGSGWNGVAVVAIAHRKGQPGAVRAVVKRDTARSGP